MAAEDPTKYEESEHSENGHDKRKVDSDKHQSTAEEEDEGAPPRKALKIEEGQSAAEDAVAFARKALEMYKQEVQDDGDFEEPDTTPATGERTDESSSKSQHRSQVPPPHDQKDDKEAEEVVTATKRWQKVGRQPMISDDPSIL